MTEERWKRRSVLPVIFAANIRINILKLDKGKTWMQLQELKCFLSLLLLTIAGFQILLKDFDHKILFVLIEKCS